MANLSDELKEQVKKLETIDSFLQNKLEGRRNSQWDSQSMQYYTGETGYGWSSVAEHSPDNIRKCLNVAQVWLDELDMTYEDVLKADY